MKIPEYGRNVQEMVEYMKTLPDRQKRTEAAHTIVSVMGLLNPGVKEQSEYKHKLWDHLYFIAGGELDVDAPYPAPVMPDALQRPQKPAYASNHIRYRYYGKNVERMLQEAMNMEDTPQRQYFVNMLASYMKMAYRMWNEDKVPSEVIMNHVRELSKGKLEVTEIKEMTPPVEPSGKSQGKGQSGQNKMKKKVKVFKKNG